MSREQPLFVRGEYKFDFDATNMSNEYIAVIRVNSTSQAGTGQGKVALGICPAGGRAFGIVQMNGPMGDPATVCEIGVTPAKISINGASGKAGDLLAVGDNGCLVKASAGAWAIAEADEDYNPGEQPTVTVKPFGKQ